MSAGSNNIVISIQDQVDSGIAPKIEAIGRAAQSSHQNVSALQSALSNLSSPTAQLNNTLGQLNRNLDSGGGSTSRLSSAMAQLASRVAGAELGFSLLGGAIGRAGSAAGLALPLIVAGLAVAAIAGAVIAYDDYEQKQIQITQAQTEVAQHNNELNDGLLKQRETLVGLTEGPLAKYRQELNDLPLKSIKTDIADLTKEWKDEDSGLSAFFLKYRAFVETYLNFTTLSSKFSSSPTSTTDVEKFVADQEKMRQEGSDTKNVLAADAQAIANDASKYGEERTQNNFKALQNDLVNTRNFINQQKAILSGQDGSAAIITSNSIGQAQQYYQRLLNDYQSYLNEKKALTVGADGELLAEQRKAAEAQLAGFNNEINNLKNSGTKVSPQDELAIRQRQLQQYQIGYPGVTADDGSPQAKVVGTLQKDIGNNQQQIANQNKSLDELVQKYKDETAASGAYSVALRIEVEQRKAALEVEKITPNGKNSNAVAALQQINESIASREREAEVGKEEIAIYGQFQGVYEKYAAALNAANRLQSDGAISANQKAIADNQASRALNDSIHPLNEYAIGLEHEVSLFGQYGIALQAATEVDRVRQELQKQGRDLTSQEVSTLTAFLSQLEVQKQLQSDINNLYAQNAGQVEKLVIQQNALNQALAKGVITNSQWQQGTVQVNIALANEALLQGKNATLQDQFVAGIGKYLQGYQGLAKGLSDAYGQAFTSIANGAADSLGRAIAYGQNLGDALKNVARQALSELLSGFIKLGIQFVTNAILGASLGTAAVTASTAQAAIVAAAWAPAAAFASLATVGENAAPAIAAVTGTVSLTEGLAALSAFSAGGLATGPGSGTSDSILARISNGEYIVNAQATAANFDLLEAINRGGSQVSTGAGITGGSGKMQVIVSHDGSTRINVQQLDDNRVRVIARQEAQETLAREGPGVIASDLQNPNSRTSKSLAQNVAAKRRR